MSANNPNKPPLIMEGWGEAAERPVSPAELPVGYRWGDLATGPTTPGQGYSVVPGQTLNDRLWLRYGDFPNGILTPVYPNELYVSPAAPAGGNGSFLAPFTTLAQAAAALTSGTCVFLGPGTYAPLGVSWPTTVNNTAIKAMGTGGDTIIQSSNPAVPAFELTPGAGDSVTGFAMEGLELIGSGTGPALVLDGRARSDFGSVRGLEFTKCNIQNTPVATGTPALVARHVNFLLLTDVFALNENQFLDNCANVIMHGAEFGRVVDSFDASQPLTAGLRGNHAYLSGTTIGSVQASAAIAGMRDLVLVGHPAVGIAAGSDVGGNIVDGGLTAVGPFHPALLMDGSVGGQSLPDPTRGNLTLTLPAQTGVGPFGNLVDITGAQFEGSVLISGAVGTSRTTVSAQGAFVRGTMTAGAEIDINNRGGNCVGGYAAAGNGTVDRDRVLFPNNLSSQALLAAGTVLTYVPPFPSTLTALDFAADVTGQAPGFTFGVTLKTATSLTVTASGNTFGDVTVQRR